MPDEKAVVQSSSKFIVLLIGFLLFIVFLGEYSRMNGSRDYLSLIGTFAFGCLAVFFGTRQDKTDANGPRLATGTQRFANYFVDVVICNVIVVTIIASFVNFFAKLAQAFSPNMVSVVLVIIVMPCYYFIFESLLQRTPAKLLTGTIVVMEDYSRPAPLVILARSFIRLIPFEPLSFFSKKGLWHDNWSKTHVIMK